MCHIEVLLCERKSLQKAWANEGLEEYIYKGWESTFL